MLLSVLSAFARRNLDPWQEAAELAALPVEAANRRLATIIEGLPGMMPRLDGKKTADRLMALLPKRADFTLQGTPPLDVRGLARSPFALSMIATGLILCVQVIAASKQPPEQVAQAPALTASTVLAPKTSVGPD